MTSKRALHLFLIAGVVLGLLPLLAVAAPQPDPDATTKIEQALLDAFSTDGPTDFVIGFAVQADLSAAYSMDWDARGEYVYTTLKQVAERSQAQAKARLYNQGLTYRSFIASNELYVRGGNLTTANALAALPEVASIRAPRTYVLDPIVEDVDSTPDSPNAIAWGISYTKADQFWTTFGLQGDGIVVANIDTGVQYDHPALDQSYRCASDPGSAACWEDPANICGGIPCDNNGHGTHTMGTMVADDDASLTWQAGMAPNATWIACKGCTTTTCPESALNTCADWILAPGGDPANRPHIVNNSWGGEGGNDWYLAKVNAWRAAGVFPAFSAGNNADDQPDPCDSLGSPGDYQESFSSAAHNSSGGIANFSSRGPSAFGHDPYTQPNIAAPGVSVPSTLPTDGWGYKSGTSMASPHSAGAVALLWSCNPSLVGQMELTFDVLLNNASTPPAGNCEAPPDGEGNYTFGYGYLDVLAAGIAVCEGIEFGYLDGYVYDADTNDPIEGASVTVVSGFGLHATTGPTGYYTMTLVPRTYDVTASKYGYASETVTGVVVVTDTVTTQDFYLDYIGQWFPGTDHSSAFELTRYDCAWFDDGTGSTAYNQKVYCMAGRSGSSTESPDIWRYDPQTDAWQDTGHDMVEDVSNYTANVLQDGSGWAIYVVSGYDSETGEYVNHVQRYYPATGTVETVSTDPWPVTVGGSIATSGGCASVQDKLYCFGGWESAAAPYFSAQTWEYDPSRTAGSRWQQLASDLSQARGYIQVAAHDDVIYAMGGISGYTGSDLVPSTVVEALDVDNLSDGWQTLASLPVASGEGQAFAVSGLSQPWAGKIYLAGGGDWPDQTAEAMAYDIASDTWDQDFPNLITARRDHAGVFVPLCTPESDDGMPGLWVFGGHISSDDPPFGQPEYFPFPCGEPTVQFTVAAQTLAEDVGTGTMTMTLAPTTTLTVTVPYTVSGTATGGGVDHTLADGTFTLNPGDSTASVTFDVIDDSLAEGDETVIVTLGTPTNANLGAPSQQTITIVEIPSSAPGLVSPGDGSSTCDPRPAFDWSAVSEATSYHIQVDNDTDFGSPEIDATTASSNYTPPSDLPADTYSWRVSACTDHGCGPWSAVWSVTIVEPPTSAPSLVSPGDGTSTCDARPAFDWSAVSGATAYHIQVDDDADFSSPLIEATTASSNYTPPSDLPADTYYWQVRASNSCGEGPWSAVWSVTIQEPLTSAPGLASPGDGSSTCDARPTFDWSAVNGATSYQIQVDDDADFSSPLIESTIASSNYTPPSDLPADTYYWQVRASNSCGDGPSSAVRAVTILEAPTSAPSLVSPSNGSSTSDTTPSFDWSAVSGATAYQIQMDDDTDFSSPVIEATIASSNYTPSSDLPPDTYSWRVRASNACGEGAWSTNWRLTVVSHVYLPLLVRNY